MPSILYPAIPGGATPGAFTPGDPGATGGVSPPGVLNQWTDAVIGDYGLQIIPVANSTGHTLVAFIGWNSNGLAQAAITFVADNAHNWWVPLMASAAGTPFGVNGAIWVAPNARPADFVSVSTSLPTAGIAISIVEMSGLPNFVVPDPAFPSGLNPAYTIGTSSTLSGTAGQADMMFTMLVIGNNTGSVTPPGGSWNALTPVSVNDPGGAGGPADTKMVPLFQQVAAGPVSAAWSWTPSFNATTMLAGMKMVPAAPAQPNPNWPAVKVEAAFGFQPGNPTVPLQWTDITARAITEHGQTIMTATRGRSYELTSPEAGTLKVALNNQDGAFNPLNTASPFYPNVRPGVPLRVSAVWQNRTYAVGYGFMDRWPQAFPTNQWGFSETQASDGVGVLANITLYSAYQSEVLMDSPYDYWPLNENYSGPLGLPFNNLAPGNAHPLLGLYGLSSASTNVPLSCGLGLNLNGDTGTGIGISGMTDEPPTWSAGALNVDTELPWPTGANNNAITVEFWSVMSTNTSATGPGGTFDYDVPLVTLLGAPSNYPAGSGQVRFMAAAKWVQSGSVSSMHTVMGDFLGNSHTDTSGTLLTDGNPHHHVYVIKWSGSLFTATHYMDGAVTDTVSFTSVTNSNDIYQCIVGPAFISPIATRPFDYTIGHLALYNGALAPGRISAHYHAGANGWTGDLVLQRFSRIMAYGRSGLGRAGVAGSPAPLFGYADTLDGQANLDALSDLSVTENGQPYTDAAGIVWYLGRTDLYDQAPKWLLGDKPSAGETPYLPDASFDYDNTYIYNQLLMQRQIAQSTSVTLNPTQGAFLEQFQNLGAEALAADLTSEQQYMLRNSLAQTVYSASDEDVYDKANWTLNKYKQPSLRLPKVTLDPASNPSIWPVALGVEQGDVVQVVRRPVGGASYTMQGVVQKIEHKTGPDAWTVTLSIAPYSIESAILNVGQPGYDTLAEGIGW